MGLTGCGAVELPTLPYTAIHVHGSETEELKVARAVGLREAVASQRGRIGV